MSDENTEVKDEPNTDMSESYEGLHRHYAALEATITTLTAERDELKKDIKLRQHMALITHGITLEAMVDERDTLRATQTANEETIEGLRKLIESANCPCCDGSGAYYDNQGEVCQCQWCDEKQQAIKAKVDS